MKQKVIKVKAMGVKIMLAAILLISSMGLAGCSDTITEPQDDIDIQIDVYSAEAVYKENALEFIDWTGKKLSDIGLDADQLSAALSSGSIKGEGKINGEAVDVKISVWQDKNEEDIVESIDFYIDDTDFERMNEMLTEIYGPASSSGEEPYVQANGGAVLWAEYKIPTGVLKLTSGSEQSFICLTSKTE